MHTPPNAPPTAGDEESLPLLAPMPRPTSGGLDDTHDSIAGGDDSPLAPPPWGAAAAGIAMHALVTVMRTPVAAALALSAFAFAFPAGLSAALLVAAVPQLLAASRRVAAPPLLRVRPLLLWLAVWAFAAYLLGTADMQLTAIAPLIPAFTTLSFACVLMCLAAHCRAHRVGPLWPRVRPLSLAPPPRPRRAAIVLTVNIAVYVIGCVAIPLMWVAVASVQVSLIKAAYAAALGCAVLAQQARAPGAGRAAVLPVLRMLPVSICAAVHACLLYAVALTPEPHHRERWLQELAATLSGDAELRSMLPATVLLGALVATVAHSVLRQRLQASLGMPGGGSMRHMAAMAGGALGRGDAAEVTIPLLGSRHGSRRGGGAGAALAVGAAEAAVWRRWSAAAAALAQANMSTGVVTSGPPCARSCLPLGRWGHLHVSRVLMLGNIFPCSPMHPCVPMWATLQCPPMNTVSI